jgi:hypothetical protein
MSNFNTAAVSACFCPFTAAILALESKLNVPFCAFQQNMRQSEYLSLSTACWSPTVSFGEDSCPSNETPTYEETPEEQIKWEWCEHFFGTSGLNIVVAESTGIRVSCSWPSFWDITSGNVIANGDRQVAWLQADDGFYSPREVLVEYFDECTGTEVVDDFNYCWRYDTQCWGFGPGHNSWNPDLCQFDHFESYWTVYNGQSSPKAPYENCL